LEGMQSWRRLWVTQGNAMHAGVRRECVADEEQVKVCEAEGVRVRLLCVQRFRPKGARSGREQAEADLGIGSDIAMKRGNPCCFWGLGWRVAHAASVS